MKKTMPPKIRTMQTIEERNFLIACSQGNLKEMKLALGKGLEINPFKLGETGEGALHIACSNNHVKIVDYLLEILNNEENDIKKDKYEKFLKENFIVACTYLAFDVMDYFKEKTELNIYKNTNDIIRKLLNKRPELSYIEYLLKQLHFNYPLKKTKTYYNLLAKYPQISKQSEVWKLRDQLIKLPAKSKVKEIKI